MPDVDRTMRLASLEHELTVALRDYHFSGTPGDHDTVCLAICACVDAMRALEWTPESVVVSVKRIARTSGFGSPSNTTRRWNLTEYDLRVDDFVSRAIRRYFCLSATSFNELPFRPPVSLAS